MTEFLIGLTLGLFVGGVIGYALRVRYPADDELADAERSDVL